MTNLEMVQFVCKQEWLMLMPDADVSCMYELVNNLDKEVFVSIPTTLSDVYKNLPHRSILMRGSKEYVEQMLQENQAFVDENLCVLLKAALGPSHIDWFTKYINSHHVHSATTCDETAALYNFVNSCKLDVFMFVRQTVKLLESLNEDNATLLMAQFFKQK
ncbi:MAG: hypothetical protein FWE01_00515 [Firmicutes bacterium]|nr:hypothetical protein [Bacillota bacterium]